MVVVVSFSEVVELEVLSNAVLVGAGLAALAMTEDGLLTSEADLKPAKVGGISVFLKAEKVLDSSLFFSVDDEVKDPNDMVDGFSAAALDLSPCSVDCLAGEANENLSAGTISVGLLSSFSLSLPSGEWISVILAEGIELPKPAKGEGVVLEGAPKPAKGDGADVVADSPSSVAAEVAVGALMVPNDMVEVVGVVLDGAPKLNAEAAAGLFLSVVSLGAAKLKDEEEDGAAVDASNGFEAAALGDGLPNENPAKGDVGAAAAGLLDPNPPNEGAADDDDVVAGGCSSESMLSSMAFDSSC